MTSKHTNKSTSTAWDKLAARVQGFFGLSGGADTSEIWELYRLSRGSDSLRPSVIRKLEAHARA